MPRWKKLDGLTASANPVDLTIRVVLAHGFGRDIRIQSVDLNDVRRSVSESAFVGDMIERIDRAYLLMFPEPVPLFRIGTRSPKRLQPPKVTHAAH
jgi:hypothetical protein